MWFLGIDIGTTHIKLVGVTAEGVLLPAARVRTPIIHDGHLSYHDGAEIWDRTAELVARYATETASGQGPLAAICVATFGQEEAMAVDAHGGIVYPSLAWWQTRPRAALPAEVAEYLDSLEHYAISGMRYRPIQPPERIAYVRDHEPEAWSRTAKWVDFGTYVAWRLTGEWVASTTQLNRTQMFHVADMTPHQDSMSALGITPELFAPPAPPGQHVGQLRPAALPGVDLASGALLVMGGQDQVMAAYAVAEELGSTAFDSMGTSEYLMVLTEQCDTTKDGYRRGIDIEQSWTTGEYLYGCAVPSGKTLHLVADLFFGGDFAPIFAAASRAPDGPAPEVTISTMSTVDEGLLSLSGIPAEATPHSVARACLDSLADSAGDALDLMSRLAGAAPGGIALLGSLFGRAEMVAHRRHRWPYDLQVSQIPEPVATGAARFAQEHGGTP